MDVRKYRLCKLPHSRPASSYLILPWLWKYFWVGGSAVQLLMQFFTHTHTYECLHFPDKQPSTFNPLILWENAISLSSHCNNNLFIACFPLMTAIDNLISYNYYKLFCLTQHPSSSTSLPVWLGVNISLHYLVKWYGKCLLLPWQLLNNYTFNKFIYLCILLKVANFVYPISNLIS